MGNKYELTPLPKAIAEIKAQCEKDCSNIRASYERQRDENIQRVESNRRILPILDDAGFELSTWGSGSRLSVHLGFFANTRKGSRELAVKLRQIRLMLGDKLGLPDKDLHDGAKRTVRFVLRPPSYPGLRIEYDRKLPRTKKGAAQPKCKIVTVHERARTYKTLVCEN